MLSRMALPTVVGNKIICAKAAEGNLLKIHRSIELLKIKWSWLIDFYWKRFLWRALPEQLKFQSAGCRTT